MAANSKLKKFHVSLAVSSSASSVETEKSDEEYTEDFHSNLQSSVEGISGNLSEISTDYSLNTDADERMSKFVRKRLQVLNENQVKRIGNLRSRESHEELGPFWIKKIEILRQRNAGNCIDHSENKRKVNMDKLNRKSNDRCTNNVDNIKPVTNVNEIGCFQSAYERLKFENLREKCKELLNTEIHSLETCKKCQEVQDELRRDEFYTSCVRKVKQNIVEEKIAEHMQSRSSALLIANIIEDGPKPRWTSDEIWDKLLSGGYQHVKCINQD
jgi:hypothetical protein